MTKSLSRPDVIITHESDLDGLISGVLLQRLAKSLFRTEVRLEAYNYHNWRQRELREKSGWVADLTFEPRMDRANWAIFDHHPMDVPPKNAVFFHDITKSTSLICYELCQQEGIGSQTLDRLVHFSNIADLFLEDDPDFIPASDYANLVKTYGFWNLHTLIRGKIELLLDNPLLQVMDIKRRIENPLGLAWSKENITEITPQVGFVDTVIGNNNLIVHQLLEERETKYPVLLTLFRRSNGVVIASLRSRNGEAVKVAERLQGGGHPNASAATLPRSVKNISDAVSYMRQVLNPKKEESLNSLEDIFASIEQPRR